jgi:GcrA cell cycle regulator
MHWTGEAVAQLTALWAEGRTVGDIGRCLGASKNAVVGKAHRLRLPPRPSPIRRSTGTAVAESPIPPRPAPPHGPIAQPIERPLEMPARELKPLPPVTAVTHGPATANAPPEFAADPERPILLRPVGDCRWPHGEPGTAGFRFCAATPIPGKPYCAEHAAVAYQPFRRRWSAGEAPGR